MTLMGAVIKLDQYEKKIHQCPTTETLVIDPEQHDLVYSNAFTLSSFC